MWPDVRLCVRVACVAAIGSICVSAALADFNLQSASVVMLFDDGAGNVAADTSGNGNDGDLVNGPAWVEGKFGGALEFNGVDSYVGVEEPVGLPSGWAPRTTLLCLKWAEVNWATVSLMGWGQHGIGGQRYAIFLDPLNAIGIETWLPTGPSWLYAWDGDTEWHHFAAAFPENEVREAKSDTHKFYFDGEPVEGDTFGTAVTIIDTPGFPLAIGRSASWDGWYFNGVIDEVAIFPTELSAEDIAAIASDGLERAQAVSPAGRLATSWASLKARQP